MGSMHAQKATEHDFLQGFSFLDTCKFKVRTHNEARSLSYLAAQIFADPSRVQPGLYELMLNAIEHGCLGIGYDLKSRLVANNTWENELRRRLSLPENKNRIIELVVARKDDGVFAVVSDPGPGFDWKEWITADPARAASANGHGIIRARSISFDSIAYNTEGNQVVAHCRNAPDIIW